MLVAIIARMSYRQGVDEGDEVLHTEEYPLYGDKNEGQQVECRNASWIIPAKDSMVTVDPHRS